MTTNELLAIMSILVTILLGLIAFIGNGMVDQLKKIANSVNRIEIDLGVLSNDHTNLKNEVKELKDEVRKMK